MRKIKIEIKWTLLFIGMQLVWMVLEKALGFYSTHIDKHHIFTNFIALPAIAMYVFALLDKKKNYYLGNISYKQAFRSGLVISIIVTILSPLTQLIITYLIAPEYFPNAIRYAVESGNMIAVEADEWFNIYSFIIQGLIGTPIMGIITSLIVAFFVKSKAQ